MSPPQNAQAERELSGGVDKNAFSASELITICKQLRIKGKSEKNGFEWDPPAQRAASLQDSQGHVRLSALLPVELPTPRLLPLGGIFHSSASGSGWLPCHMSPHRHSALGRDGHERREFSSVPTTNN